MYRSKIRSYLNIIEMFHNVLKDIEPVSAAQIAEIEMKYFPQDSEAGLFRICR